MTHRTNLPEPLDDITPAPQPLLTEAERLVTVYLRTLTSPQTIATYDLEYGVDALEAHIDSIPEGIRVLVVDDLLATGGTARAMCQLVENAGGTVAGVAFLIELTYLRRSSRRGTSGGWKRSWTRTRPTTS